MGLPLEVVKRILRPQISKANIAVTWKCNQYCRSCNIWQKYRMDNSKLKEEFTTNEFETFIKYSGLIWVSLTGGEPTLRHDIGDLLCLATKYCLKVNINSNGSNTDALYYGITAALKSDSSLSCNIALEGSSETHNKLAGTIDSFEKALNAINKLSAIKDKKFRLKIETVYRGDGIQIQFVKSLAEHYRIPVTLTIEQSASFYENTKSEFTTYDMPKPKFSFKGDALANYLLYRESQKTKQSPCVAGLYSVFIDPYLNVYPCLIRYGNERNALGNLRQNGYQVQQFKTNAFEKYGCRCATPCESQTKMLFRPWRIL